MFIGYGASYEFKIPKDRFKEVYLIALMLIPLRPQESYYFEVKENRIRIENDNCESISIQRTTENHTIVNVDFGC